MSGQKLFTSTFCRIALLGILLTLGLAACGNGGSNNNGSSAGSANGNILTPTMTSASASATTGATVPLSVTSVSMAVSPQSLNSYACGTNITVTYTATFHFPANNAGGQVAFQYTTDNGRGSTQAGLTVQPGQTTVPYQFTWSGALPSDHTMPEPGGVIVTTPNSLNSQMVGPSGSCSTTTTPSAFKVTAIELSASPTLTGQLCGTLFTETYTAIFHFASNGPGGTLVFTYTTNNGRSNSQNISLTIAAGQTTKTYTFTWTGLLPADHTAPGVGIVLTSAPNQAESPGAVPSGQCS